MLLNEKEYIKVYDDQAHESDWAYYQDNQLILDNQLGKHQVSSIIKIDEQHSIIDD